MIVKIANMTLAFVHQKINVTVQVHQKNLIEKIFINLGFQTEFIKDMQGDWRVVEVRR